MGGETATVDGTGRSLTLDQSLSALTQNVLEFAASNFPSIAGKEGPANGAFGFYPRMAKDKMIALGNKVVQLQEQYGVVKAIVLDDPVGVVQELNNGRLDVIKVMTDYQSKTEIRHKKMISDAIQQIRAGMAEKIAADPSIKLIAGKHVIGRNTQIREKTKDAMGRLEDYYHESARADFASEYELAVSGHQRKLKAIVLDLSVAYRSVRWKSVIDGDYSPETNLLSWAGLLRTLAGNLQGGMVGMDKSAGAVDGGKTVWASWMNDPTSPPFKALLAGSPDLMKQIHDGEVTYSNLKTFLNADETGAFLNSDSFRLPATSLVMALNGAMGQLNGIISTNAEAGFLRVMSALACAAQGGAAVTVYSGPMTVRDFQHMVRTPLNAHGQSVLNQQLGNSDTLISSSRAGHWPEITDPLILDREIQVKIAAPLKTVDSLAFKQALRKVGTSPSAIKAGNVLTGPGQLSGLPELTPQTVDASLTHGEVALNAADMRRVAAFMAEPPPSFYAGSLGVVLAVALLGSQIVTMRTNMASLKTWVPDPQSEMALASGTLLMMATGAEIVGQAYTIFQASKSMVHPMLKVAGVIDGIAVVIDGISLLMKSVDTRNAGDSTTANLYFGAGFVSVIAGGIGIYFGAIGDFALATATGTLGPIGWCILLGILALILTSAAASNVRSPLERWLSHTCFGVGKKRYPLEEAWSETSLSDLQKAMKALHVIASGLSAQLVRDKITEFSFNSTLSGTEMVVVLATLPDCSRTGSDWLVELAATGGSGNREILARNGSPAKLTGLAVPKSQTTELTAMMTMGSVLVPPPIKVTTSATLDEIIVSTGSGNMLQLSGEYPLNTRRFTGMELKVSYWPDKSNSEEVLQLMTTMDGK